MLERVDAAVAVARERRAAFDAQVAAAAEQRAAEIAELEARGVVEDADEETSDDVELSWGSVSAQSDDIDDDPSEPTLVASVATTPPASVADIDDALSTVGRDWHGRGLEYQCAPTTALGEREDLDRLNSQSVRAKITAAVRETVEIEGTIELDRLARDVGRRFGFDRVSASRKSFVIECVPAELVHASPLGSFVWRVRSTVPNGADTDHARWRHPIAERHRTGRDHQCDGRGVSRTGTRGGTAHAGHHGRLQPEAPRRAEPRPPRSVPRPRADERSTDPEQ
ncbi:hypothetical protein GS935_09110 [Rhodococcus hoagii]|nr:hypothetical protein [Prescottella equi]